MSDPEYTANKEASIPDVVPDFGELLRTLRNNHGYSIVALAKRIGLLPTMISQIELTKIDLPTENILRKWCEVLGCGKANTKKIILLSRQYRIKHYVSLKRKESCNPDFIRLLDAYREDKLTEYDRRLLQLIARGKQHG